MLQPAGRVGHGNLADKSFHSVPFYCFSGILLCPYPPIFTLFPLHMRVYNHCLSLPFFLSLSPSATPKILQIFFLVSFNSIFMGPKYNFLLCLQVGNDPSHIIAQTILILTKIMLHKGIWLLGVLVKSDQ